MRLGEECEQLLAVHSLSGCDTVSYPYGKGKATAVSVRMHNDDLRLKIFGDPLADDADLLKCGTRFMCLLYGCKPPITRNALHHIIFTGSKKIQQLSPTDGQMQNT